MRVIQLLTKFKATFLKKKENTFLQIFYFKKEGSSWVPNFFYSSFFKLYQRGKNLLSGPFPDIFLATLRLKRHLFIRCFTIYLTNFYWSVKQSIPFAGEFLFVLFVFDMVGVKFSFISTSCFSSIWSLVVFHLPGFELKSIKNWATIENPSL